MKFLFDQSESEKRAGIAAINLFFSVVLGANLGSINTLDLYDYSVLLILLAGSVMAIYTIAVSRRRRVIWMTAGVYSVILGGVVLFPELRPDRMEEELLRIVVTLAIWLLLLMVARFSPLAEEPAGKGIVIDDEDEVAELLAPEQPRQGS